jgi:hypothetical protein
MLVKYWCGGRATPIFDNGCCNAIARRFLGARIDLVKEMHLI